VLPAWPEEKCGLPSVLENHTILSKQASGESLLLISPLLKTPIHHDDSRRWRLDMPLSSLSERYYCNGGDREFSRRMEALVK
jgi:hypothetical protein